MELLAMSASYRRSILDGLPLSGLPRVRRVLEAFPERWFFHCETPAFLKQRAACNWSVPFRWSVVDYEPYDVTGPDKALQRMRLGMLRNRFKVAETPEEQAVHWPKDANGAYRAWHDWQHVKFSRGFSFWEEITLADDVSGRGTRVETAFIHWVETICQVVGQRLTGDFPAQSACLTEAEERAIILRYEETYRVRL